jgi:hypothetical protein
MASPEPIVVPLVTFLDARTHLRVDGAVESPLGLIDQDIEDKILQASHIVTDYIKRPDHGWTDEDAPPLIRAAVLIVLTMLFDKPEEDPLSPGVKSILHRYRDPAIA